MSLFKSIVEVRKYVSSIDANTVWEDFKPFIDEAEAAYIAQLLGDLYTPFLEDYTENYVEPVGEEEPETEMSEDNAALLPYVQRCLAYYAALQAVPHLGVVMGSGGLQEQFTQNSRPAPRYKIRDLSLQYIIFADKHADILLDYLEANAAVDKYQEWLEDETANTRLSGCIVYKTPIASQFIDINESRRIFLRLKKHIKNIEQREVKKMICTEAYEELIQQIKDNDVSEENQLLLDILQPYISKKALYLAMPSLRISVTHEGITMHSSNDGVVQKTTADKKEVDTLLKSLKDGEQGYEADWKTLDQFLIDNIGDYPLIEDSPCYTSKSTTVPRYQPDNDPCNKHFST